MILIRNMRALESSGINKVESYYEVTTFLRPVMQENKSEFL